MHASKHAKFLSLGLTALMVIACDNGSDDPPPPPPPGDVNLLEGFSDMDASYAANSMYWNHYQTDGDGGAEQGTVTAGTYAGMDGGVLQLTSTNFGTADWNYQMAAGDGTTYTAKTFTLVPGKVYTISYKAAASNNGQIRAYLKIDDSSDAGSAVGDLTSTTATFTSDPITVTANTPVTFVFNLGALPANTIVYLDDVTLMEADVQ